MRADSSRFFSKRRSFISLGPPVNSSCVSLTSSRSRRSARRCSNRCSGVFLRPRRPGKSCCGRPAGKGRGLRFLVFVSKPVITWQVLLLLLLLLLLLVVIHGGFWFVLVDILLFVETPAPIPVRSLATASGPPTLIGPLSSARLPKPSKAAKRAPLPPLPARSLSVLLVVLSLLSSPMSLFLLVSSWPTASVPVVLVFFVSSSRFLTR
mmetsp:Transcript_4522/g.9837  ORF Transcript_4522/g.9837 Transcript_4522/m.9837 type:complete len:208 (-) Transcript_4522:199-822(-)